MNIRIDPAVKQQGDSVLKRAGYTPTRLVRELWDFACAHAADPNTVKERLDALFRNEAVHDHELEARVASLHNAAALWDELSIAYDLDADCENNKSAIANAASNAELREVLYAARAERFLEEV